MTMHSPDGPTPDAARMDAFPSRFALSVQGALLALGVLLALLGAFYLYSLRPGHDWGDDFSMYIRHALNLAQGEPYGATGYVYNLHYPQLGPRTYPPGYPLLLTPVASWFGLDLHAFKVVTVLAFLAGLAAIYWALQLRLPPVSSLGIVLLLGLTPWFWQAKDSIISDLPFLLPQFLALGLIARSEEKAISIPQAVLLGVCFGFATSIRTTGILLPGAFFLAHLIRQRTLRTDAVVALAVFAGLLLLQRQLFPSGEGYLDQLRFAPRTFVKNLVEYTKGFSVLAGGVEIRIVWLALSALLLGLMALGFLVRLRERISAWELFFVFHLGLLVVWPDFGGVRLLVPLLPMGLFYIASGLIWLSDRFAMVREVTLGLFLILVLANLAWLARHFNREPLMQGVHTKESQELFDFVQQKTPPDAVFAFQKPRALALFTNRKATAYHLPEEESSLWNYFSKAGVQYLIESKGVFEDEHETYLAEVVRRNAQRLNLVFTSGPYRVYALKE